MKITQSSLGQPSADEETPRLLFETARLHDAIRCAENDLAREFGLTSARWEVLGAACNGHRTVSGLARDLRLSRQSVQHTVERLAADGFVRFVDNPEHLRAKLVDVTEKGTATLALLGENHAEWVKELSADMPAANIRIAIGIMRGLLGRLAKNG